MIATSEELSRAGIVRTFKIITASV